MWRSKRHTTRSVLIISKTQPPPPNKIESNQPHMSDDDPKFPDGTSIKDALRKLSKEKIIAAGEPTPFGRSDRRSRTHLLNTVAQLDPKIQQRIRNAAATGPKSNRPGHVTPPTPRDIRSIDLSQEDHSIIIDDNPPDTPENTYFPAIAGSKRPNLNTISNQEGRRVRPRVDGATFNMDTSDDATAHGTLPEYLPEQHVSSNRAII